MFKQIIGVAVAAIALATPLTLPAAEEAITVSVAQLFADKDQLAGKQVHITGEVVKVNNNIMGKNFLHIQDGSGGQGTNDVTVTSRQTAEVGDRIEVDALVTVDRDFGMGYSYEVILEEAKLSPATQ